LKGESVFHFGAGSLDWCFSLLVFSSARLFHALIAGINIAPLFFAGGTICSGGFVAIDLT
jgi:hypothetical protein